MTFPDPAQFDYTLYYLKWHSEDDRHRHELIVYYTRLLSPHLPKDRKVKILEIGCGMGFTMLTLQNLGFTDIEGIDVDKKQIQSCKNKNLKAELVNSSEEYLSMRAEQYDVIIALDLIEHIPHSSQLELSRKIYRALKSGGRLICTVPNANSSLASRWRYNDWTHHLSFTEHSIEFLLKNAGFDSVHVSAPEFILRPWFGAVLTKAFFKRHIWMTFLHWFLFRTTRFWRRLEMVAELGWSVGLGVPLSLNLLSVAEKKDREN